MTREDALSSLAPLKEVGYTLLDDIFLAFGFQAESPDDKTQVYRHPRYPNCGKYVARERYHYSVLSEAQKEHVLRMLQCVEVYERYGSDAP
jgi:hypothetical protein